MFFKFVKPVAKRVVMSRLAVAHLFAAVVLVQ